MTPQSMRFCIVSDQAEAIAATLDALGMERRPMDDCGMPAGHGFAGAIFAVGNGWIEIWPASAEMPAGQMIQLQVTNADAVAETARANGLAPDGPMDAHGERIYFVAAPGGLQLSFQSVNADR